MAQCTFQDGARAIPLEDAEAIIDRAWAKSRPALVELVRSFQGPIVPAVILQFELALLVLLREFGRTLLEQLFNGLEAEPVRLPHDVLYLGQGYRRLNQKTRNQHVATLFGKICLWRCAYRFWDRDSAEGCIFPLELQLGLVEGVTPALASFVGQQMAQAGATQQRVLQALRENHGVSLGVKRLRKLTAAMSSGLGEHCQDAQVEQLLDALQQADASCGDCEPVVAVGRDGITLRQYLHSFFEVATAATVTVYDRAGKRVTTIYLAWQPELGQATMSGMLTGLIEEVLRQWTGTLPTLGYVTDSGDNESSYFEDALKKMRHPVTGQRLAWQRVVDFYHAAERIWTMSENLFGKKGKRYHSWARRMLRLLKKPNGPKRVLHSAAAHLARRKLGKKRRKAFNTACNYIRKRTRWMQYADYRKRHIPLGSGITEAACKTIYTQRLKLSGMRWSGEGAQQILTLRTILLSRTWHATYDKHLAERTNLIPQPYPAPAAKSKQKAA